ncbi:MAG: flagellar export protein FliJ [Steroidobacteraceae bacterium]
MSAVKQLEIVQRVTQNEERRRARGLAERQRRVSECEAKLLELERYEHSYKSEFARAAERGMNGARVREYQAFLERLANAVRQQLEILSRARAERDAELCDWRRAAQQAEMVEHVVVRRRDEERVVEDRREQRAFDELSAMRSARHGQ